MADLAPEKPCRCRNTAPRLGASVSRPRKSRPARIMDGGMPGGGSTGIKAQPLICSPTG